MTTYRQIAHKLRIARGPGNPDRLSARPRQGNRERGWGAYLDSDDAPTLVTFEPGDLVDVDALLRSGAIAPYTPPAVVPATPKGGRRGQTAG